MADECDKVAYPTKREAKVALRATSERGERVPWRRERRTYRCHRCRCYHLTSLPLEDWIAATTLREEPVPFTCPRCSAVSHHPDDVEQGYCGRCSWWTGHPVLGTVPPPGETDLVLDHDQETTHA